METRVVPDAAQLPEGDWDALASNAYQTRAWFLTNQQQWSGIGFSYFAAYRGGTLRAILPVYDRPGDLYVAPSALLFRPRSRIAAALAYAIVGSPMSFDSDVIGDRACLAPLLEHAASECAAVGADVIAFPFCREPIRRRGVVCRRSLVDFDLELPGRSFDDYLASLSRRRRGEVRREIRAASSLRFEDVPLAGNEHVVAAYRRFAAERHGRFTNLEAGFYKQLAENTGERSRVLLAISPVAPTAAGPEFEAKGGRVIGASCYLEYGGKFFLLHGGALRERFAYFNLTFYELIRQAYRRGVRNINFRPASDEAKSNRGCVARRTVACFEPISFRGRAALAVLVPALDSRRWIERRLRRAGRGRQDPSGSAARPGAAARSTRGRGPPALSR